MAETAENKVIPIALRLPSLDDREQPGARFIKRTVGITLAILGLLAATALLVAFTVKMDVTVKAGGSLEPVRIYPVRVQEGGPIREVLVNTGDTVKAGQVVARLDSLALAAELAELEARYRTADIDRRRSSSADPLERQQASERARQAQARVTSAQALLKQRMVEYDLGTNTDSLLRAWRPGTHITIDQAVSELRAAQAEVSLSGTQGDLSALSRFDREKLGAQMEQLQAQIRLARERLGRLTITSPASGVVLTEQIERLPGSYVREGDQLLEIGNLEQWRVTLLVPERDVHKISTGDSVKVEIPAFDQQEQRELLGGRVVHVASEPLQAEAAAARGGIAAPTAREVYRVVASLDRAQLEKMGIEKFRRGYTVQGNVITKSGRISTLLWNHIVEKLDR
jgi:multidrug resistance efflux pump